MTVARPLLCVYADSVVYTAYTIEQLRPSTVFKAVFSVYATVHWEGQNSLGSTNCFQGHFSVFMLLFIGRARTALVPQTVFKAIFQCLCYCSLGGPEQPWFHKLFSRPFFSVYATVHWEGQNSLGSTNCFSLYAVQQVYSTENNKRTLYPRTTNTMTNST